MSDWHKDLQKAEDTLAGNTSELFRLGHTMCEAGNPIVGEQLLEIARENHKIELAIRKAKHDALDEAFRTAQTHSVTMLGACLAGAELAKGEENK
jgi:hypothetical protein